MFVVTDAHSQGDRLPGAPPKWHLEVMETVYEAVGGAKGLLGLAEAWHARVMADEVVSHAFSHGFHPEHTERLAARTGRRRWEDR